MKTIKLQIPAEKLEGKIHLPASKSISNRVLLLQTLSKKDISIQNISKAGDSILMSQLLENPEKILNTGNTGTVIRFLTAFFATQEGEWELIGSERMKERPIKNLVDVLRSFGADITYLSTDGFPPIGIKGKKLSGGKCKIDAGVSSQYISALLMIAPFMENGIDMELAGTPVSYPYVEMTIELLKYFGIKSKLKKNRIIIKPQNLKPKEIKIEPDWTAASYIYALASLHKEVNIELPGLIKDSLQGDCIVHELMEKFGVSTRFRKTGATITKCKFKMKKFEYDFKDNPDLVPTFAVLCTLHKIPFKFSGIHGLRIKESDRINALALELKKIGLEVEYDDNNMSSKEFVEQTFERPEINSYSDHRIVMSFALAASINQDVVLQDPDVVEKSYPDFWSDLETLGITFRYLLE